MHLNLVPGSYKGYRRLCKCKAEQPGGPVVHEGRWLVAIDRDDRAEVLECHEHSELVTARKTATDLCLAGLPMVVAENIRPFPVMYRFDPENPS